MTKLAKAMMAIWGSWRGVVKCPENHYVDGFQARIEEKQGGGDDTALNGLKFRCFNPQTNTTNYITIFEGLWGSWRDWHHVNSGQNAELADFYFLDRFQARFEGKQGSGDDTALNGLKFYPINYMKALLKNVPLANSEQAILDEKLKLPPNTF